MSKLKTLIIGILVVIIMLMIGKSIRGDEGSIAVQPLMDAGVKEVLAVPSAYNNHEPLPEGTFNVQIQALEVTQGVRGNIPSRDPSADNLTLSPDGAFHVADRRTVVRAYPRMISGANAIVPPLTAQLWVYRDGLLLSDSPVSPVNVLLENISPDRELEELRGDASLSWNFLLPSAWTASNSEHQSFSLRFVVVVNPSGLDHKDECQGCTYDNEIILEGQTFVHVPPIKIKPYLVDHDFTNVEGKELYYPTPTVEDLYNALDSVHQLLPIGDGEKGIVVLEPEFITFNGPVKANGKHLFAEAMIQRYLPGRSIEPTQDGVIHIFLFSPSYGHRRQVSSLFEEATTGLSWIGGSYVQAGARGSELAHELVHAIGMDHAGSKHGEATYDPDYPDDHGRVEPNAYGFDVWSMQAVPPDYDNNAIHDLMSYGRFRSQWVSIYTWKTIAQLLGQPNI